MIAILILICLLGIMIFSIQSNVFQKMSANRYICLLMNVIGLLVFLIGCRMICQILGPAYGLI